MEHDILEEDTTALTVMPDVEQMSPAHLPIEEDVGGNSHS